MNDDQRRRRRRLGALLDSMKAITAAAGDRPLTKAQATDFETFHREVVGLRSALGEPVTITDRPGSEAYTKGVVDELEAWASKIHRPIVPDGLGGPSDDAGGLFRKDDGTVRVLAKGEQLADLITPNAAAGLSMARYVKAVVTGDWKGIDPHVKSQSEGLGAAGGYLVPEVLSARVIDRARAAARVFQAGALTVPMDEAELHIARLATGVTATWKSENAPATASDMTFERVTFRTRTLMAVVKASVELLEDAPQLNGAVEDEFAKALALELDRACLRGTGAANEPLGILNQPGIGTTAVGGALTRYSNAVNAIRDIRIQNFEPDFLILPPRTLAFYDGLEDTTNQPLQPPPVWNQLAKLSTTSVPTTLGAGSDTELYFGRGEEIMVGVRTTLRIEASRDASDFAGSAFSDLQVWIRAYLRADIALAHPAAFQVLTGVTS